MANIDRALRSNVKLRHLQLLVALDEFRHLGRAAEFLSLTQPAVSKSLAEIERMFGLDLFIRSTRGTEPTPFGERWSASHARCWQTSTARAGDRSGCQRAAGRTRVGAMVVATPMLLGARGAAAEDPIGADGRLDRGGRPDPVAATAAVGELDSSSGASSPATRRPTSRRRPFSKNR